MFLIDLSVLILAALLAIDSCFLGGHSTLDWVGMFSTEYQKGGSKELIFLCVKLRCK